MLSNKTKSLIFKRAWSTYKLKLKHNCNSTLKHELKNCWSTAKLIGYVNYKPSGHELINK
jgi:hypothetical protein